MVALAPIYAALLMVCGGHGQLRRRRRERGRALRSGALQSGYSTGWWCVGAAMALSLMALVLLLDAQNCRRRGA
jgi:hypothetical protein